MYDHVEPRFNRALDPWSGKCVVGDRNNFSLARDFRDRLKVDQFEQRIAWGFDPNHACVRFDCALDVLRVG